MVRSVRSPIDLMSLDDVDSVRVRSATDYTGDTHTMRWTELFLIRNEVKERCHGDPGDLTRLAEALAQACSLALTPHLGQAELATATKIGLRVTIDNEQVNCYYYRSNIIIITNVVITIRSGIIICHCAFCAPRF